MTWDSNRPGIKVAEAVRRAVRRRDGDRCQLRYEGCTGYYQELDHIIGIAARGLQRRETVNDPDELQCVCKACHKQKTAWQAKVGRGLGAREPERSLWLGPVTLPAGFRYAPRAVEGDGRAMTCEDTPGEGSPSAPVGQPVGIGALIPPQSGTFSEAAE
ncbi:hypothetical protein MHPYR_640033 [uncultured Mycobacterium sp.]|uniref:HNH nuclease domain-containing protein n=1 Tax=uncultured Mycobacterium sp. TaxID=171292 RepID=A0A1Y5PNG2_9MYCO|nr:hypothetical protein MHPYR_100176 [uncultured Mycobacterium sp.]SBS78930.1 hypothetical protein MHPYR_640033 [uncultured Mycobacterium sp.]